MDALVTDIDPTATDTGETSRAAQSVWLPTAGAALALGISEKTVYRRLSRGDLDRRDVGGRTEVFVTLTDGVRQRLTDFWRGLNLTDTARQVGDTGEAASVGGQTQPDPQYVEQLREEIAHLRDETSRLTGVVEMLGAELRDTREVMAEERRRTDALLMRAMQPALENHGREVTIRGGRRRWWSRLFGG